MRNFVIFKNIYRPIIYSSIVSFCLVFLMTLVQRSLELFWIGAFFTFAVLVMEFFITSSFYQKKIDEGKSLIDVNRTTQILHHFFLPSIFYWSTISFIFSNQEEYVYLIILILFFVVLTLLLKNIHAFYDYDRETKSSNYIYDLATIIIVFFVSETLLINFNSQTSMSLIAFVFVCFVYIFLNLFTIIRHHLTKESLFIFLVASIFQIILLSIILGSLVATPLLGGLAMSLGAFVFISVINQMIESHNLFDVLVEFSILILLIFALIQFSIS